MTAFEVGVSCKFLLKLCTECQYHFHMMTVPESGLLELFFRLERPLKGGAGSL
jgi:hypothetical protein